MMNRDRELGIWPELKRKPKPQFVDLMDKLPEVIIRPRVSLKLKRNLFNQLVRS